MTKKGDKPKARPIPRPIPTEACICKAIPENRAGLLLSPEGVALLQFHMDCPDHGIVVVIEGEEESDGLPDV